MTWRTRVNCFPSQSSCVCGTVDRKRLSLQSVKAADQKKPPLKLHQSTHIPCIPPSFCPFLPPTLSLSVSSCTFALPLPPPSTLPLPPAAKNVFISEWLQKKPRLESQRRWRLESVKPWYGTPFYPTWKRRYLSRVVRKGDTEGLSEEVEERIRVWGKQEDKKERKKKKKHVEKNEKFSQSTCFSERFENEGKNRKIVPKCPLTASHPPTQAATHTLPRGFCSNQRGTTNQQQTC